MEWVYDDGGRASAGFRGCTNDCVTRAVAIAAKLPYVTVYSAINAIAQAEKPRNGRKRSGARTGVMKPTTRRYIESLGWVWTPTISIGSGCKVHLRNGELPMGCLIISVSRHIVAVIDGIIHDTHDCSRGETRCVYGYWSK